MNTPDTKPHMTRVNLYLPTKQVDEMRAFSKATGLSMSELHRRALDIYLEALAKAAPKPEETADAT
jgi:hypothetical protein